MTNTKKELIIPCPHCDKKFSYYESEFRPFCCEKCKMIDLGQWLNESYAIPTEEMADPEDSEENT